VESTNSDIEAVAFTMLCLMKSDNGGGRWVLAMYQSTGRGGRQDFGEAIEPAITGKMNVELDTMRSIDRINLVTRVAVTGPSN